MRILIFDWALLLCLAIQWYFQQLEYLLFLVVIFASPNSHSYSLPFSSSCLLFLSFFIRLSLSLSPSHPLCLFFSSSSFSFLHGLQFFQVIFYLFYFIRNAKHYNVFAIFIFRMFYSLIVSINQSCVRFLRENKRWTRAKARTTTER